MGLEQDVRDHWDRTNKKDVESLTEFFTSYKFLTNNDYGTVLGIDLRAISRFRERAGLTDKSYTPKRREKQYEIPPELSNDVDPYEDTKEWWQKHIEKFGYRKLAKLAGIPDPSCVPHRLRKHGIPLQGPRKLRKPNPCDNYEWLYKYHVKHGLGRRRMSLLAGVTIWTIGAWLSKHKVPRRQKSITHVGQDTSKQAPKKD